MNSKAPKYSLNKGERLCSRSSIGQLFSGGNTFLVYPLKFVWIKAPLDMDTPAQVGFSVSKRLFKRAVQRNRLKRLMREAYRLEKPEFYSKIELNDGNKVALMIVFIGRELLPYHRVEGAMKRGLSKIARLTNPTIIDNNE